MNQSALMSFILDSLRAVSSWTRTQRMPGGASSLGSPIVEVRPVRTLESFIALATPQRMAEASIHHAMVSPAIADTNDQKMNGASARAICSSIEPSDQKRNRSEWIAIADFLARQNLRDVLRVRAAAARAEGAPLAGKVAARTAAASALPVGNHGEIYPEVTAP